YSGHPPAVAQHIDQHRRSRYIVVPEIVMNRLKRPDQFARGPSKSDNGVGVPVLPITATAEVIRRRAGGRKEDQIALGVRRNYRPYVGTAYGTGTVRRFRLLTQQWIERPSDG